MDKPEHRSGVCNSSARELSQSNWRETGLWCAVQREIRYVVPEGFGVAI